MTWFPGVFYPQVMKTETKSRIKLKKKKINNQQWRENRNRSKNEQIKGGCNYTLSRTSWFHRLVVVSTWFFLLRLICEYRWKVIYSVGNYVCMYKLSIKEIFRNICLKILRKSSLKICVNLFSNVNCFRYDFCIDFQHKNLDWRKEILLRKGIG